MKRIYCSDTIHAAPSVRGALLSLVRRLGADVGDVFRTLCAWQERHEMRCRMRGLDDRLLDDIGLSREAVEAEASKPFWKN